MVKYSIRGGGGEGLRKKRKKKKRKEKEKGKMKKKKEKRKKKEKEFPEHLQDLASLKIFLSFWKPNWQLQQHEDEKQKTVRKKTKTNKTHNTQLRS